MTPETEQFINKARRLLIEAKAMLGIGLNEAAGRTAYLAGFHAAQAYISERNGRTVKTRKGVHTEIQRLTKDDRQFAPHLRSFLSRAYNLKSVADYETAPSAVVTPEEAARAVAVSEQFIEHFARLLADGDVGRA